MREAGFTTFALEFFISLCSAESVSTSCCNVVLFVSLINRLPLSPPDFGPTEGKEAYEGSFALFEPFFSLSLFV